MVRPTLLSHPRKVAGRVPFVDAVPVEAGIGATDGPVTAHRIAIRMLGRVGANDAAPALAVGIF